ncbi:MAG: ComEC/Rec2 family competence protein [Pirellulaceae bacterium]|nr:ComEC/Rec2 family competence protein [Pirellulaceae bacterium]
MEPPTASAPDTPETTVGSTIKLLVHRYPLVGFVAAWILGIGLAALAPGALDQFSWWPAAILSILLAFGWMYRQSVWIVRLTSLVTALLAAMWMSLLRAPADYDSLSEVAMRQSQPIALRGVIISVPVWSPNQKHRPVDDHSLRWVTQWNVRWHEIGQGDTWTAIQSTSRLKANSFVDTLLPGDEIEVHGLLTAIWPATNPGMHDAAKRASRHGRFVQVTTDSPHQIVQRDTRHWNYWPVRLRGLAVVAVNRSLHRYVSNLQAPLAAALVFGQREQVDWQDRQQLMTTGTIHMLAISGLHVDLVAGTILVLCLLVRAGPRTTLLLVVGACMMYAVLAGGKPPVLRAVILITTIAIARYWGHQGRLTNLLGLAALVLLVFNPQHLTSIGVVLSFMAVATLGTFSSLSPNIHPRRSALQHLLEENLSPARRRSLALGRSLFSAIRMSFWVWLMAVPLIWHHFHLVSPIAILLNIVLMPPLTISLIGGLVTGLLGWLAPIGWLAGQVTGASLSLILWLVECGDALPAGHVWLPAPPLWWSITFYAVVVFWLLLRHSKPTVTLAMPLVAWLVVGVAWFVPGPRGLAGWHSSWAANSQTTQLRCTFLDVGHGTCVVIELPDGRVWLYDAGHLGDSLRSHEWIAPTLWHLGICRVDTLILSHADADHYNAVPGLLTRFGVGRVASTRRFWNSSKPDVRALQQGLRSRAIQCHTWDTQTSIAPMNNLSVLILHPPGNFRAETDNADSLCLQLEFAGVRLLLTGDVEGSGMATLCGWPPRHCEVMMAPHHGSLTNDVSELINWCQPKVIVVSGSQRTVRLPVLDRFAAAEQLGITFRDGAIQVRVDTNGNLQTLHWDRWQWTELASQSGEFPAEGPLEP